MSAKITIEVAYATKSRQEIVELVVDEKDSARDAIKQSGIKQLFPEIDLDNCDLGVFGKLITPDYSLVEGDRIEIYRPLIADPKEIRRRRAAQGLKMKKGGGTIESN